MADSKRNEISYVTSLLGQTSLAGPITVLLISDPPIPESAIFFSSGTSAGSLKCVPIFHCSEVYTVRSLVITETILGFFKINS